MYIRTATSAALYGFGPFINVVEQHNNMMKLIIQTKTSITLNSLNTTFFSRWYAQQNSKIAVDINEKNVPKPYTLLLTIFESYDIWKRSTHILIVIAIYKKKHYLSIDLIVLFNLQHFTPATNLSHSLISIALKFLLYIHDDIFLSKVSYKVKLE